MDIRKKRMTYKTKLKNVHLEVGKRFPINITSENWGVNLTPVPIRYQFIDNSCSYCFRLAIPFVITPHRKSDKSVFKTTLNYLTELYFFPYHLTK